MDEWMIVERIVPPSEEEVEKVRSSKEWKTEEKDRVRSVLTDGHQRFHNYLRISLTERCNLRCVVSCPEMK